MVAARNKSTSIPAMAAEHAPSAAAASAAAATEQPSMRQLRLTFLHAAIPMVGFGIMDQTIMLHCGHMIDCSIGVTFGLSTLTSAAFGQVCSDASGVMFGSTLESLAGRWTGLPRPNLSLAQKQLKVVQQTKFAGSLLGVIFGCMVGLLNLLIIDTERSSILKLQAYTEGNEFEFQIEVSNALRDDATALTVRGPDLDGILASMTAALAVKGCSLVELHAKRLDTNATTTSLGATTQDTYPNTTGDSSTTSNNKSDARSSLPTQPKQHGMIEDVFFVVDAQTGLPYEDDDLEDLGKELLDATRTPMNISSVKAIISELENANEHLRARVRRLESKMTEMQILVVPRSK
jgi:Transmembrane protein 65